VNPLSVASQVKLSVLHGFGTLSSKKHQGTSSRGMAPSVSEIGCGVLNEVIDYKIGQHAARWPDDDALC
jgi:hypothetical protein